MKRSHAIVGLVAFLSISVTDLCAEVVQESGDFIAEVERLKNLAFAKDSGLYVPPTPEQQTNFTIVAEKLFLGQIDAAYSNALSLGYEVVEFTDTNTSLAFHGLREILQAGEQTNGWGAFFVNLAAEVDDLIEVPHPLFDTRSWDVAARVFVDTRAQGFLMAAAHRNANGIGTADVAHLTNTIFHIVHQAWNGNIGQNVPWQIHGFNVDNYSAFPSNTDAILSNGDGGISEEILILDESFHSNGFVGYAYNTLPTNSGENVQVNEGIDGTTFSPLGATLNVQGIHSRSIGGMFVHVELEQSIRFNASNRVSAAALISDAVRLSSKVPPEIRNVHTPVSTSTVMQVDRLVRTRQYHIQKCTNLIMQCWSTNITFSASAASTNLSLDLTNHSDAMFFRVKLDQAD